MGSPDWLVDASVDDRTVDVCGLKRGVLVLDGVTVLDVEKGGALWPNGNDDLVDREGLECGRFHACKLHPTNYVGGL